VTDKGLPPTSISQFQALLQLESETRWAELSEAACRLLAQTDLLPHQRALTLQLQAEARRHEGDRAAADEALSDSVGIMAWPLSSLTWLEKRWEKLDTDSEDWTVLCRSLVLRGHGGLVIRRLMAVLGRLPLAGQRERLLNAIETSDALLLSHQPMLNRQWRWLRRTADGAGNGYWA